MTYSNEDLLSLYDDAEFYDIEFGAREFELPFYMRQCGNYASILEVACGTGRLTIPIKQTNIDIKGRDISPAMIKQAIANAKRQKVQMDFLVQDAEETTGRFDLIFIATNAFQHFLSYEKAIKFLCSAKKALNPGGRLIIDIQVPNMRKLLLDSKNPSPYKSFHHKGDTVNAVLTRHYDNIDQIYTFKIDYISNGVAIKQKNVAMRMFFPQELLALFAIAELRPVQVFGDYDENKLKSNSPKQIYILEQEN